MRILKFGISITYNNIINGKKYGVLNLIESMENINNRKVEVTCSLFINGVFVFSSVGNIYRCYRYVGDEKYKIGNIDDKNINLLNYKSKKAKIEKCSNCWAQILCKDGCAYAHELFTGDINTPDENWCNKTKIIQKESLMLYARLALNKSKNIKNA